MVEAIDNLCVAGFWFFVLFAPILLIGTIGAIGNAIINREK